MRGRNVTGVQTCALPISGAKNGIFPVDDVTKAYLAGRSQREPVYYEADPDAEYEQTIEIDLSQLVPTVSYPHLPENTHPASEGRSEERRVGRAGRAEWDP